MSRASTARQHTGADWLPDWCGHAVAILGGGPSLNQADVDKLKGRVRIVAINEAWRLCPWADMLYACDAKWWRYRRPKPGEFVGLRVGLMPSAVPDILVERSMVGSWSSESGTVVTGANSGFQALQIAVQTGGNPILLLGFDMKVTKGGMHWHGAHDRSLGNPTVSLCEKWRKAFETAAPFIAAKVINCTPGSALMCFPKATVDDALERAAIRHEPR